MIYVNKDDEIHTEWVQPTKIIAAGIKKLYGTPFAYKNAIQQKIDVLTLRDLHNKMRLCQQQHNMGTTGSSAPLLHEILVKVNNAKDKAKKIDILREHDSVPLRQVLKRC